MAGLIQRRGIYYIQFDDKQKRKRFSLKTKRRDVARRLLVQLERDYELGEFDPFRHDPFTYKQPQTTRRPQTLDEALSAFLAQKEVEGRSPNTIDTYRGFVGQLVARVGKNRLLDSVEPSDVEAFVRDATVAKSTRHTRFRHVRAFFRWCVREELIAADPTNRIEAPEKSQKLPKSMSPEELQEICRALESYYAEKRASSSCREGEVIWQVPMYWFSYFTGLRGSELSRLRWKHIDIDKRLVYIYEQKNGKEQTIPLNQKAAAVLKDVPTGDPEDYVFRSPSFDGRQRSAKRFREHIGRTFKKAREQAGIDRKLTLHCLRHSFCTRIAEAGKSAVLIKEAARHADISTSMIYVHLSNEHLKAELDDVFG